MNYLKFSHEYSKLKDRVFTTIRRGMPKFDPGELVECKTPTQTFNAIILYAICMETDQLPTDLLIYDTDQPTREEAMKLFQSFYRTPIEENNVWTLYLLKKEA